MNTTTAPNPRRTCLCTTLSCYSIYSAICCVSPWGFMTCTHFSCSHVWNHIATELPTANNNLQQEGTLCSCLSLICLSLYGAPLFRVLKLTSSVFSPSCTIPSIRVKAQTLQRWESWTAQFMCVKRATCWWLNSSPKHLYFSPLCHSCPTRSSLQH